MRPRAVLGMTLHNNAHHLREAADSILAQTERHFMLLMLDDGSVDETEAIAREYERRDERVRYFRHAVREGMVPTWREVAQRAAADYPGTPYFAWVSDHDRWDAAWLGRMCGELDADPDVVLAYPVTLRIDERGSVTDKEPRSFQTVGIRDVQTRWRRFCAGGVGAGDMVYGVMRTSALAAAGWFRDALNPDRLLIAELSLLGQVRQVDEPLWWRREAAVASVARQRDTLFAGTKPRWFAWPPTLQHVFVLWNEYRPDTAPVRLGGVPLARMLVRYVVTSAWRHYRKTDVSKSFGRGVDNVHHVKKLVKKGFHHAVYHTLVGLHRLHGRSRRLGRRAVYEVAMFAHRTGLRGRGTRSR